MKATHTVYKEVLTPPVPLEMSATFELSRNNGYARLEEWITRFKNGSFKAAKGLLDFRSKNSRIMIIEYLSKLMIKLFCMLLPKLYLKLISRTE